MVVDVIEFRMPDGQLDLVAVGFRLDVLPGARQDLPLVEADVARPVEAADDVNGEELGEVGDQGKVGDAIVGRQAVDRVVLRTVVIRVGIDRRTGNCPSGGIAVR